MDFPLHNFLVIQETGEGRDYEKFSKTLVCQKSVHKFNVSLRWINKLLALYSQEGLNGPGPKSRRPRASPGTTNQVTINLILEIRYHLIAQGIDAGPKSIAWQISNQDLGRPSNATI